MDIINNNVARFQKKHVLLFSSIFVFVLIAFMILIINQNHEYLEQDEKALLKYFKEFQNRIDTKFSHIENGLIQIKSSAEADLFESHQTGVKFPFIYKFIKEKSDENYYHMDDINDQYRKNVQVNLTGHGSFRNRGPEFDMITSMGLKLADEFYALKKTLPNLTFVYCMTKEKQFIHHPWLHSKRYRFDETTYSYDIWKLGLPENNPKRNIFWTDIYIDVSADGGIMGSCGISLYDQDNFVGVIGADITVDFLNKIVSEFEPKRKGYMVVFDKNQNMLAHPDLISYNDKEIKKLKDGLPVDLALILNSILKAPNDIILEEGKWKFIKSRLSHSPFSILYYFPRQTLTDVIISRMGYGTMGFIGSMLILAFASLYITHKKLVQPAEKFVNFILAKSRGKEVHPDKKLSNIWKPWFLTIDNVFNENNNLNESIKQNNITLENKNVELEKEIEAKNKAEKEKEVLEKQLIEEEKLKAIGLLVGGIAHDFNNQLAIIMGYASVLRSQLHLDEAKRKQCLEQMLSAAESSSGLIKQLLAFAQKGKYQNIPIDINEMINEMILILNHTIDKRISIKVDFSATRYTMQGDQAQIQNAIMNIAINAKNAMPNGGMITFKTANEIITEEQCKHSEFNIQPGEFIKISITDTGTGITDENKKRIFEPFFTTKNSGRGTGLGLAATLGAIKNHYGYITVENAAGTGASFSVLLPVMRKNVIGKSTKTRKINVSKSKSKLLLIDDEPEFCRMLTDFMGALGYTIITYTDPLEAMEYYKSSWQEVDLVIMDMIMPKISGHDMINEFQKINPLARIVISSGYSAEKDVQKLLKNHEYILGFYRKPFDLVQFANDISSLLKQEA
jgi:signal transduction histidine kinase